MPASRAAIAVALAAASVAAVGVVRVATWPSPAPRKPAASPVAVASRAPVPLASPATPAPRPKPARPSPTSLFPLPAPPAPPSPCPPPARVRPPYRGWKPPTTVPDSALPAPAKPQPDRARLDAISGKGMWVYQWQETEGGNVAAVVRRARALGLTQLWVRSGSSRQGFYAGPLLTQLLPAAHRAGLDVLVWDFPYLHDPVADARRAVETLEFRTPDGHQIDGFSPDIETAGENVIASGRRVAVYLGEVDRAAGNRPLVATVPWPSAKRLREFPYGEIARYTDAFAAMTYWSCREPGRLAADTLRGLLRWDPVHLIGQAYDMTSEGGRPGDPTPREIWRFLDVGKRLGAIGVSFYVWQAATDEQLRALAAYPW